MNRIDHLIMEQCRITVTVTLAIDTGFLVSDARISCFIKCQATYEERRLNFISFCGIANKEGTLLVSHNIIVSHEHKFELFK